MPVVDKLFPDTVCKCGRVANIVHCPACGSCNVEGRVKDSRGFVPTVKEFEQTGRWWSCRRCKIKFSDRDRAQHCEAPPFGLSMKAQRVSDVVQVSLSGLSDEERKAKLTEMFGGKKK
jgi:hypothetical protein